MGVKANGHSRWFLCLLMAAGVVISYIDRVNISHSIIPLSAELNLSVTQQGLMLSAFSWGYVVFMLLGGILVDRVGAVRVAGLAAVGWSVTSCLTGFCNSFFGVVATRFALGGTESPIFPANARLVRENFAISERARATAIFDAGSYVGVALAAPLVVLITLSFGWRFSFISCGVMGLIWVSIWLHVAPKLSRVENKSSFVNAPQIFNLIKNRKVIGASYGFFCYNYAKSFYLTWFPAYLINEKGYSFLSVGLAGAVPPICAVVGGLASGWTTDWMITRGISLTYARKGPLCIGLLLSSTIILADFVTSKAMLLAILSFSFSATIAASPGIWAIPGDIAPTTSVVGTISGIQNTFSNFGGIVAPVITGLMVSAFGNFTYALLLTSVLAVTGAASYWFIVGELTCIELRGNVPCPQLKEVE